MTICLFWHGESLRPIERICIASMLHAGHEVDLYVYAPVRGVPDGVRLRDAREIMPEHMLARVADGDWTLTQYSDVFRVMLMKHERGVWLDGDTYLGKRFEPDPARHFLAWEDPHRCGVSALYFPSGSPIIRAFEDYLAGGRIVPDWLGFRRRVLRPLMWKALGWPLKPRDLGITAFGNDGITRLAKRHGLLAHAAPKGTFYYWNGKAANRVYDPVFGLAPLSDPDFTGFHFASKGRESREPPRPGSFFHWAAGRVAHLL